VMVIARLIGSSAFMQDAKWPSSPKAKDSRECLGFSILEREPQDVAVTRGQTLQLGEARAFEFEPVSVVFGIVTITTDLRCRFSLLGKGGGRKQRCTEGDG
jgi:hypothetical protein